MTDSPEMYLYGAGGHARVVADVLRAIGVEVRGQFNDYPHSQHPASVNVRPGVRQAGIGQVDDVDAPVILCVGNNAERAELAELMNVKFGIAVHPSAIIAPTASIGEGTVVLHGAVVQANSVIGRHALINTAASVDHDNILGDYVHVSPHATLCGHVEVGEGTHVGAGAVVIPKVKIGRWCTVGAGTVVIRDVPDHTTVVGNPARIVPGRSGQPVPVWLAK